MLFGINCNMLGGNIKALVERLLMCIYRIIVLHALQPGSSRPNTAPGKMQRPVRLKPIHNHNTTASLRRSSPYRLHGSSNENDRPFNCTVRPRHTLMCLLVHTYRMFFVYIRTMCTLLCCYNNTHTHTHQSLVTLTSLPR